MLPSAFVERVLDLIRQHRRTKHVCQQSVSLIKSCQEISCVMGLLSARESFERLKCFINQGRVAKGKYVPYDRDVPLLRFQNDDIGAAAAVDASTPPCISLYRTQLEGPFLADTRQYCARLRGEWLSEGGLASYLARVLKVLREEKERPRL